MKADELPPQIKYVYLFQAFNAISWMMCLASPLILFAREMGASAFVIGLISAFTPLLSILQLPMAWIAGYGYRFAGLERVRSANFLLDHCVTVGVLKTLRDDRWPSNNEIRRGSGTGATW